VTDWTSRLEETVKECSVLAWAAYYGNADERFALRSIRNKLDALLKQIESREANA
jgi:hypothetical protein